MIEVRRVVTFVGHWMGRGMRKLEMFYVLIWVAATWGYTYVGIHCSVHKALYRICTSKPKSLKKIRPSILIPTSVHTDILSH